MMSQGNRGRNGRRDNGHKSDTSATISRGRTRPNVPTSCKFKTEMCHYLMERSQCPFGDNCTYAHTDEELRLIDRHPRHRTQLCRDFNTLGFCPFGERCSFIHTKESCESRRKKLKELYRELMITYGHLIPNIVITGDPEDDGDNAEFERPPTASSGYSSALVSPAVSPSPDKELNEEVFLLEKEMGIPQSHSSPVARSRSLHDGGLEHKPRKI